MLMHLSYLPHAFSWKRLSWCFAEEDPCAICFRHSSWKLGTIYKQSTIRHCPIFYAFAIKYSHEPSIEFYFSWKFWKRVQCPEWWWKTAHRVLSSTTDCVVSSTSSFFFNPCNLNAPRHWRQSKIESNIHFLSLNIWTLKDTYSGYTLSLLSLSPCFLSYFNS